MGTPSLQPKLANTAIPPARTPVSWPWFRISLRRDVKGLIGGFLLLIVCTLAIAAPLLAPHDPLAQTLTSRLLPPSWEERGLAEYPWGTDGLGRDLMSRVIYGARISLTVSAAATVLAILLGLPLGLFAGYYRGRWESVIMGLTDIQLAFPFMLLALTFMAVFEPGVGSLIIVLALSGWASICRLVRSQVLALRERDFVLGARAVGAKHLRILWLHIFPNIVPVLLVIMTINIGRFVIAEASLSFVGLGVSAQTPSWGAIINAGREYIWNAWWITTIPGIAITLTVVGVGLFGDWLRTKIDPRLRV